MISIPLIAILSTLHPQDDANIKVYKGGERAKYALEQCMLDSRDMHSSFVLKIEDSRYSFYEVNCQILETTTVPYYAVKGIYFRDPLSGELIRLFEEQGLIIE